MLRLEQMGPVTKFQLARGVLGKSVYHTAAYWVDGLMIDTGCAHTARELLAALDGRQVDIIVNTHSHEDHIGANGLLQRHYGAKILAHRLALPVLSDPRRQRLQPYRRFFWGWPEPSQGEALRDWVTTPHYRFQILDTPGHSTDHVCLYEPREGWLFSGDTYIGGQERAARPDYDYSALIRSLHRLATLRITLLFPSSGTVRAENASAEIQRKATHLEELREEVRSLYSMGHSADSVRRQLLGRESFIHYLTLGHFGGEYLVRGLLQGTEPQSERP